MLTHDAFVQLRKGEFQHFYILRSSNGQAEPDHVYHSRIRELATQVQSIDNNALFIPCWDTDRYHFRLSSEVMEPQQRADFLQIFLGSSLQIAVSESLVQH